jgi:hypothetical protein
MSTPVKRDVYVYAAIGIALLALLVAAYAIMTMPKPYQETHASATVKLPQTVYVEYPGTAFVDLGWIYVDKAPAVVTLRANSTTAWFYLNGVNYGNPATLTLEQGNHTVALLVYVPVNGTKIKIEWQVVS